MARRRPRSGGGGGGSRPTAAGAPADRQQEAKEGTSPVDLTSIWLREDEEERPLGPELEQEQPVESPDLPTLLDQLEQSLSAAWDGSNSPAASGDAASRQARKAAGDGGETHHDSDDDMQQEEARLKDSAQKLKKALDESTTSLHFYDASSTSEEEEESGDEEEGMEDAVAGGEGREGKAQAVVPARSLSFNDTPSPLQPPAPPIQPSTPSQPSPPTPISSATPSAYWDCPDAGEEDDLEEGFATPLGTLASVGLRHSSSAFSLGFRSLTGSPVRLASALRREAPQEEEEGKGEDGPSILANDDDDGSRDMHEVVCAAEWLIGASFFDHFSGLRSVGAGEPVITQVDLDAGPGTGGPASSSPLCRHMAIVKLRPDVVAGAVTTALVGMAQAQGLLITKRQGPHVVAEMPGGSPHRWEWRSVDMQLAIERERPRDRILLVRFLLATGASPPSTPCSSSSHHGGEGGEVAGPASAEARRRRPATRAFLDALRGRLVELGFNRHALARLPGCKGLELDGQYLEQLEDLRRELMNGALEAHARTLEDHARAAELRCAQLKGLLQPMFDLYKIEQPALGKPLPLSYYPLNLLGAYQGKREDGMGSPSGVRTAGGDGGEEKEEGGAGTHAACPARCMACVEALKDRAWDALGKQCDAEMAARLQRKNTQVTDRLGRVSEYERFLLRTLRDNRYRMSIPLFKTFREQQALEAGSEDVETPLYYCRCIMGARPATLYVTYGHLVFISRLPGFSYNRRVPFRDVRAASLSSLRLGFSKLAKAIEIEVPAPAAASGKRGGGGRANEAIVFSSTTEPERLIELIKLLVSIHAEDADGGVEG